MKNPLTSPVQYLKGIGPKRSASLAKLGIVTIEDIFYCFPRRYEDRTNFISIHQLKEGETRTIKAEVLARDERRSWRKRGFTITEVAVGDKSGKIFCVWFNRPYLKEYLKVGLTLILYGKIERYGSRLQMNSPEFEIVSGSQDESLNIGRIVPVYSLPEGITQRYFRQTVKLVLDDYLPYTHDSLPYDIRIRNDLLNLAKALINIHFPDNPEMQKEAYRRLSFDEFFLFLLPLALRKMKKQEKLGVAHNTKGELAEKFLMSLPFKFTKSQGEVIAEIKQDMASGRQMQRLLQGDVGSGKTVVASIAGIIAVQGGYQTAFMVPTEILARQHYQKISSQLAKLGPQAKAIKLGMLTGSMAEKEKKKTLREIEEGKINFIIGTHALLQEEVSFKKLGLVIIDEQHKFGVAQRALLPRKGVNPDVLIMTATPIPRTLAITLYGDLDVSVINELPPGRLPIKTMLFNKQDIARAYHLLKEQLRLGHQAYIIYPVIEESYALDMAGAKKMYAQLKAGELKEFKLGLIHGKLKQEEQDEIMLKFKNKELNVLVSTTILEVGIDIPEATCMVIENAQRFGLSQLHQLRGRIGRGSFESSCLLISGAETDEAKARLNAMAQYSDGFRIAEEDLKIRGPGEFFGQRQHGLTELKIANPLTQLQLLKRAREEALKLISKDPYLSSRQNTQLKEKLLQRFPEYENFMVVG